jgi:hypothetical protein
MVPYSRCSRGISSPTHASLPPWKATSTTRPSSGVRARRRLACHLQAPPHLGAVKDPHGTPRVVPYRRQYPGGLRPCGSPQPSDRQGIRCREAHHDGAKLPHHVPAAAQGALPPSHRSPHHPAWGGSAGGNVGHPMAEGGDVWRGLEEVMLEHGGEALRRMMVLPDALQKHSKIQRLNPEKSALPVKNETCLQVEEEDAGNSTWREGGPPRACAAHWPLRYRLGLQVRDGVTRAMQALEVGQAGSGV